MVSIRARFMSRAIRLMQTWSRPRYWRFNPRPVYEPGDTTTWDIARCASSVSIRARFMSRAIPRGKHRAWWLSFCFNPRPVYEPGDTLMAHGAVEIPLAVSIRARFMSRAILAHASHCGLSRCRFNPRPVYEPGDTSLAALSTALGTCFNPRPVYEPGDTAALLALGHTPQVSIRARFMSRAIHFKNNTMARVAYGFNPRPVYEPGDTTRRRICWPFCTAFQSAPGL